MINLFMKHLSSENSIKQLPEFKSRKEWQEYIWQEFIKKLYKAKSAKQTQEYLESFLSARERDLIIKRIIATALISQGKKYREIGEILWLSHNTISAIKKGLLKKTIYHGYKYYRVQKLKNGPDNKNSLKITIDNLGEATLDFVNWLSRLPISPAAIKYGKLFNSYEQDKAKYSKK